MPEVHVAHILVILVGTVPRLPRLHAGPRKTVSRVPGGDPSARRMDFTAVRVQAGAAAPAAAAAVVEARSPKDQMPAVRASPTSDVSDVCTHVGLPV